jgi:hypothetical protein
MIDNEFMKIAIDLNKDYFKDSEKFKNVKKDFAERKVREFHNFFVKQRDNALKLKQMGVGDIRMSGEDDEKLSTLMMQSIGFVLAFKDIKPIQRKKLTFIYNHLVDSSFEFGVFEKDWFKPKPKTLDASKHLLDMWLNAPDRQEGGGNLVKMFGGKAHAIFVDRKITSQEMEEHLGIIKQAYHLMSASKLPHFDKAFYGNFYFMEHNKGHRHYAFYYENKDEVWINSSLLRSLGNELCVQVLIHELGHRYYRKVLNQKEKDAWENFYSVLIEKPYDKSHAPKVGDSLSKDFGFIYPLGKVKDVITRIEMDEDGLEHKYFFLNSDGVSLYITDKDLAERGVFPTAYARKNSEEMFCETLSLYSLGMLSPSIRHIIETEFENHFVIPYVGKK